MLHLASTIYRMQLVSLLAWLPRSEKATSFDTESNIIGLGSHAVTLVPLGNISWLLINLVIFYQAKGSPDISAVIRRLGLAYVCSRSLHLHSTANILIDRS